METRLNRLSFQSEANASSRPQFPGRFRDYEIVYGILEKAIGLAVSPGDYAVKVELRNIPLHGDWGFSVKVVDYCQSKADKSFYVRRHSEIVDCFSLYTFLKSHAHKDTEGGSIEESEGKEKEPAFGRTYVFKSRALPTRPPETSHLSPIQEKFPLGLILLCHELGIQVHDMGWFTERQRTDEFAVPSDRKCLEPELDQRAEKRASMKENGKSVLESSRYGFENIPQVVFTTTRAGFQLVELGPAESAVRCKTRVYCIPTAGGFHGPATGSRWTTIVFMQYLPMIAATFQWEHPNLLDYRSPPDYLCKLLEGLNQKEIGYALEDEHWLFKPIHRALLGCDLRQLNVISALLKDVFARLGSGKGARDIKQQDLYSTLTMLKVFKGILEKRLADLQNLPEFSSCPPNSPTDIPTSSREHLTDNGTKNWKPIVKEDVEFALEKIGQLEKTAQRTITLLYNIVAIHESQSVLWLTKMAFLFLPLTFVATIFGMNLQEFDDHRPTTALYIGIALVVMLLTVIITAGPSRIIEDTYLWMSDTWDALPDLVLQVEPSFRIYLDWNDKKVVGDWTVEGTYRP